MQNSGYLALKLVEIFKFLIIHRSYNGGCIKEIWKLQEEGI